MSVRARRRVVTEETGEVARETTSMNTSGLVAGIASAVALIFSGISLYHSVLKQPDLRIYVPQTIHYTRDPTTNGEVFILPITVANHGARDGTVLLFRLTAEPVGGGEPKFFESSFQVGEDFFVRGASFNRQTRSFDRVERPRTPFAPISVAGRSHFTGSILFFRAGSGTFPRVISDAGRYRLTLETDTIVDETLGVIDRALTRPIAPIVFEVETGRADDNRLKRGNTQPMRRVATPQ